MDELRLNLKFGLALDFWNPTKPLSKQVDDFASLLQLAERYDFDSVWAGEGHLTQPAPNHVPSPLLMLAAIAQRTRLRLGTGVLLLPLYHPLRVAHEAAILDHLTDGRLTLGIAIGHPQLWQRYGIPANEVASRMDEALLVLKKSWLGETQYRGKHFEFDGRLYPGPVQSGGPPLWVGGNIRRSLVRAAELADGWYAATEFHFEAVKRQARRYRELLKSTNDQTAHGTVCVNRATLVAKTDRQAIEESQPYIGAMLGFYASIGHLKDAAGDSIDARNYAALVDEEICLVGSVESCVRRIRKYRDEAGVDHINFRVAPGDMPLELARRSITLLGESVIPQI